MSSEDRPNFFESQISIQSNSFCSESSDKSSLDIDDDQIEDEDEITVKFSEHIEYFDEEESQDFSWLDDPEVLEPIDDGFSVQCTWGPIDFVRYAFYRVKWSNLKAFFDNS